METSLSWLGRLVDSPGGAEWQRLSEVYEPLIAGWVARAGVAVSNRDDLVQEVLIVVVRKVGEFEHQHPGAFRAWLKAILANQLKKYFRENARLTCLIPLYSICDPSCEQSQTYDREHDEYLAARAMQMIKHEFEPNTWQAFHLQVIENYPTSVVAAQLGISINAVIKAKSRVLKRLRDSLSSLVD